MANTRQRARLRYLYHLLVSKPGYEYQRMIGDRRYVGIPLLLLIDEIVVEELDETDRRLSRTAIW